MIYTVVPLEMITGEALGKPMAENTLQTCETILNGGIAEGRMTNCGFVMTRLVSTDPKLYLDKRYQPGCIIQ